MTEMVRYRVTGKAFINGSRVGPGDIITAPAGLKGAALELLDPPVKPTREPVPTPTPEPTTEPVARKPR